MPTAVFLPGYASDMRGDKASAIAAFCAARGQACLRLDYSGNGESGGRFEDGTIGRWTADAECLIERLTTGPLVLIGSSMGGWIALLLARRLHARIAGLIGIAAAPDFTETLPQAARAAIERDGMLRLPSRYGGEQVFTRALLEDGRAHALFGAPIAVGCPVRLLQGQQDPDVPWPTALRLAEHVTAADVRVTLIKDGDHRLSRPQDIALLCEVLGTLLGQDGA